MDGDGRMKMRMAIETLQTGWPNCFMHGDAVLHKGRRAHIMAFKPGVIPAGRVPIMYDDR